MTPPSHSGASVYPAALLDGFSVFLVFPKETSSNVTPFAICAQMTEVSDSLVQDTNHVLYPFSCDTNIQVQVQTTLNLASLCMFKASPRFVA